MKKLLTLLLVLWPALALAQDPIPAARKTDWSYAGVPGGIPTYSQICQTFNSTTGTAAAINAAIVSCGASYPNGSVVYLTAGTYTWASAVTLATSKVVLRGAGADQTIIRHPDTDTALYIGSGGAAIVLNRSITGGGVKDSFSFTVSSSTDLSIGSVIDLFRDNDTDYVVIRDYPTAPLVQTNRITNIAGSGPYTITVANPLVHNFSTGNPVIYQRWLAPYNGMGIEDLKLDHSTRTTGGTNVTVIANCYNCWVKGVETYLGHNNHFGVYSGLNIEIRDSFIHDSQNPGSNNSGIDIQPFGNGYGYVSNVKIENNIFDKLFPAFEIFGGTNGNVIAYNYILRPQSSPSSISVTWSLHTHAPHSMMNLFEGNITPQAGQDGYTGSGSHDTYFRNLVTGATIGLRPEVEYGNAFWLKRLTYYYNIVGNVIGCIEQVPPMYETPPTGHAGCGGWCSTPYELGFPNMSNLDTPPYDGWYPNSMTYPDAKVKSTLFRWGNYDFYYDAVRWEASEVPSDVSVPGNQLLRSSYYLTSKPAWFGSVAFPPIGPDVTATTHGGVGTSDASGHANKIPAQLCWESRNLMTGGSFNANSCYYGTASPPNAPTNVRIR